VRFVESAMSQGAYTEVLFTRYIIISTGTLMNRYT